MRYLSVLLLSKPHEADLSLTARSLFEVFGGHQLAVYQDGVSHIINESDRRRTATQILFKPVTLEKHMSDGENAAIITKEMVGVWLWLAASHGRLFKTGRRTRLWLRLTMDAAA